MHEEIKETPTTTEAAVPPSVHGENEEGYIKAKQETLEAEDSLEKRIEHLKEIASGIAFTLLSRFS